MTGLGKTRGKKRWVIPVFIWSARVQELEPRLIWGCLKLVRQNPGPGVYEMRKPLPLHLPGQKRATFGEVQRLALP
jgi:hypothetical protein